jgi:hypothetical protein
MCPTYSKLKLNKTLYLFEKYFAFCLQSKTYVKGTQTVHQGVSAATQYSQEHIEVVNYNVTMVSTEVQCMLIGQPLRGNAIGSEDSEEEMEVDDDFGKNCLRSIKHCELVHYSLSAF